MSDYFLAIESSCDDTSVAVMQGRKVLSNIVATQEIHSKHGGVVPELASRAHQQLILPTIAEAISKAGITKNDLKAIAYTRGPGLMGSLLVGSSVAKGLAISMNIPLIEVNHMEAHILALMEERLDSPDFPFICLTVSGGHTQLVRVDAYNEMTILGATIDDAAGEAFDKTAKLMGLPYPGGPLIDKYGQLGEPVYSFPKPKVDGLNFSFSGLKTAILYFLRKQEEGFVREHLNDICASVQHSIVGILMDKLQKACKQEGISTVGLAGGVSANSLLRSEIQRIGKEKDWNVYIPPFEYCTDNAAMIGIAASFKLEAKDFGGLEKAPLSRLGSTKHKKN